MKIVYNLVYFNIYTRINSFTKTLPNVKNAPNFLLFKQVGETF